MRKKHISFILFFLFANIYGQITIMKNETKLSDYKIFVYDSLKNMTPEKYEGEYTYHHLIGQTLMYCGDPYSSYSYFTNSNFKIGNYYRVDGILPDDIGKGLYHRLSLTNLNSGERAEESGIRTRENNFKWIVLGYYEKMKSLYVNKVFVYLGDKGYTKYYYYKHGFLINLKTETIINNIIDGTVWNCVDIQVKQRKKGDGMDLDKRSPIVLIFDNPKYGKHYCYLEDENGDPYNPGYGKENPLLCGMFQLKSNYDNANSLDIAAKNKRKAILVKKYGTTNANKILKGMVVTGWSKAMCIESWGEPLDINKTSGSFGYHEQWVYGDNTYLYFENGKLTTIQN